LHHGVDERLGFLELREIGPQEVVNGADDRALDHLVDRRAIVAWSDALRRLAHLSPLSVGRPSARHCPPDCEQALRIRASASLDGPIEKRPAVGCEVESRATAAVRGRIASEGVMWWSDLGGELVGQDGKSRGLATAANSLAATA
jgi:hypothetical protein